MSRRRIHLSPLLALSVLLLGAGPCAKPLAELCTPEGELVHFEASFQSARVALGPWVGREGDVLDAEPGRSPASAPSAPVHEEALSELDRHSWQSWAEEKIHQTQEYFDMVADRAAYAAARKELSELLNELVAFHGYATHGRSSRMDLMLGRIHARSVRARALACETK